MSTASTTGLQTPRSTALFGWLQIMLVLTPIQCPTTQSRIKNASTVVGVLIRNKFCVKDLIVRAENFNSILFIVQIIVFAMENLLKCYNGYFILHIILFFFLFILKSFKNLNLKVFRGNIINSIFVQECLRFPSKESRGSQGWLF